MSEQFDKEIERLLADRLDGDLTPPKAVRLQDLLAADCQAEREATELERVDRAIRTWGARSPGADWSAFHTSVMERVSREPRHRQRTFRIFRMVSVVAPLAAAAVVAVVLTLSWPARPKPQQPAPQRVAGPALVQVTFHRPAEAALTASAGQVRVVFHRSAELERNLAAREAEGQSAPSLAVATGGKAAAPVAPSLDAFPI